MISLYTQRVFCWHTLGRRALQEAGMNVNSSPEQAIKTLVPGLIEMARSDDENSKKIFKAFVEAAAGKKTA